MYTSKSEFKALCTFVYCLNNLSWPLWTLMSSTYIIISHRKIWNVPVQINNKGYYYVMAQILIKMAMLLPGRPGFSIWNIYAKSMTAINGWNNDFNHGNPEKHLLVSKRAELFPNSQDLDNHP